MLLESWVGGRWLRPSDEGAPLLHAVTGDEVARVSTRPVAAAEALRHAREVGGPALRELTFHQRAALLKQLGTHLMGVKEAFSELSFATGATARDSLIDVDGGFGTLLVYASKGRRELPDGRVVLDGPVEQLGRRGTFVGRHLLTPLRGAAVQVNAYNFPVWGMLEKLAPAFLAGVPSVVKPASATAYLTEQVVRSIVESGILPEGSLQLLVGGAEGLVDELGGQDLLGFTGSAATARVLRRHPAVVERGVRFNAEADSLNCAVLGLDAKPGTEEFDLFVREVVREMTAKAGQKCTAIRRAFVPREHLDAATEALRAALAEVVVGDPRDPATGMGALVSTAQRDAVRDAVARLAEGGEIAVGDPDGRRRRPRAGRVPAAPAAAPPGPDRAGGPRRRGLRPGRDAAAVRHRRAGRRPHGARPGQPRRARSSATTPTSCARSSSARPRTTGGCTCSTATAPASRRGTAHRSPTSSTADRAAPAAVRSSAASAGCSTTCSAPRCRARPTR